MMGTLRLVVLALITTTAFGQHAGGFAAPSGVGIGRVAGPPFGGTGAFPGTGRGRFGVGVNTPRIRSAFGPGQHFGYGNGFGYGYPGYYPLFGYDQSLGGYPEEYPSGGNVFVFPPAAETSGQPAPPPPQPASAVIHEYKVNPELATTAGTERAFTIALKDGSTRSAVAFWVQHGNLYYIDSQDRQQVLSSDLIDRETTERLNREKNLTMQLPPS